MKKILKNKEPRFPSVIMYEEDEKNKSIIESYWQGVQGRAYSFAGVTRMLWAKEAEKIQAEQREELSASAI